MTNEQLYLAIGIPLLFNASLIGIVAALLNSRLDAKFDGMSARFDAKFDIVNAKFDAVNARFDLINVRFDTVDQRFDEMRDLWRAELRRVEEVLDARLKHIESH